MSIEDPVLRVATVPAGTLTAPDGSPVYAVSGYTAPPPDGRPLKQAYPALAGLGNGQRVIYISEYPVGTKSTPDGRPVYAITSSGLPNTGDTTPPTITSGNTLTVTEGQPFNHTLTANEPIASWSKIGGADQALFSVSGNTLSMTAKDFEVPADADGNNTYVVTVRAMDGAGNPTNQTITVTVTDAVEGGGAFPVVGNDFGAPEAERTSAPTAYPVTTTATFFPSFQMVGDTLRITVASAVQESGGLLLPSGAMILNDTITLVADPVANNAAINGKLATINSGAGFVFLRSERGAQAGAWSIPVQYGTAAVPAITSPLTFSVVEGAQLAYNLITASPAAAVYIVGQDGDRVEFTNAKPGSTFALRFTGGATKTFPADDFNTDNVYDIGFEVVGLNGVRSATQSFALTLLDLDLEAEAFNFADVANVPLSSYGESPTTITVGGLTPGYTVPVSVGAGTQVQIDGGAWGTSGNVQNGSLLKARVQTPGVAGNTVGTVNYGGQTDNFNATNVGYVAPVLSTWASSSGDGFADGSITLSNANRTATMTRAEGDRRIYSPAERNSGKLWVEIVTGRPGGTAAFPLLSSDASGTSVIRYQNDSGAGDAGGGWNLTFDNSAAPVAVRWEVDFAAKTIAAFVNGAAAGTKAFPTGVTALRPGALLAFATGPYAIINTGQQAPVGTVTAGFSAWG